MPRLGRRVHSRTLRKEANLVHYTISTAHKHMPNHLGVVFDYKSPSDVCDVLQDGFHCTERLRSFAPYCGF